MEHIKPEWKHHRVIHSKYPPLDCFESDDAMILGELESATSDRVAHWPRYVDESDFRYGPGWGPVMASFCYPAEGRFNTLSRGAYYAGDSLETALREWVYHSGKVWQGFGVTNDYSAVVRCYTGHTAEPLVDLRNQSQYMHDTNYAPGQRMAADLLNAGEYGVLFSSIRHPGAEAIALLRPSATTPVIQSGHYVLQWNGERFTQYARLEEYCPL
ncbi:RES family NAD+ phosphorylase [Marinobacter salinexigens]|uniref:RES family NAD+ phosphorylase n=1 Tax=Marinobacter salinexigens TaxID=2919747 RepID=A0A5B0VLE1_9GAMM|nr:RES family NAD+ phosphorylase [Marinobacter salinexigens]KAA1174851.1 RES family NAD+ phosphorylase [Marinobacter salinexigens]